MFEKIKQLTQKIKQDRPLVLNITNDVTMDFIANGLLSLGASPVMSQAEQDVDDLIKFSQSIVINLGTLNEKFIELCEHTCRVANTLKKPIILDPVGAGATKYRTDAAAKLLDQYHIAIIRGNASEIMALSAASCVTKGVDSTAASDEAVENAKALSKKYNAAVVISGKTDFIIDADKLNQLDYGSALMPMITGTGCLLSSVVGAFHAAEQDRFLAASAACAFYGVSGEIAAKIAKGPGSFKPAFLDALYNEHKREWYEKN